MDLNFEKLALDVHTFVKVGLLASVLWLAARTLLSTRQRRPPGPPAYPVIGNILHALSDSAWVQFARLQQRYGDLVYLHGLGNRILVVNTMKALSDLLDKRATIYSDRPKFTVVGDLMGLGQSMPLLPYGKEWREHRKLAHLALSLSSVKKYHRTQEDLAALLCRDLLEKPADFFASVRLTAGRLILSVTYGLPVERADDEYITHAEATMEMIGHATRPGAFMCDLLPIMKHLPSWMPFHKAARIGKDMILKLITDPFVHVKNDMANGVETPSLVEELLRSANSDSLLEERVKWTAGAMYGAGGESTYATVLTFMMAMSMYPDVQSTAQKEIDAVIGTERLPVVADRDKLPYVNALIKETMRWHPALPLSIARLTADDDTYEGYFIPKGTIVMPNVWAIAFEPNSKYDPQAFIPERFLDPENKTIDPAVYAFGFGRRICPGKALAENSLFVLIASILASIAISPVNRIENPEFEPHLVSYPKPFKCGITPRSPERELTVKRRAAESTS